MKGQWWIYPKAMGYHVNCSPAHFVAENASTDLYGRTLAICNSNDPTNDLFSRTILLTDDLVVNGTVKPCKNCLRKIK